MDLMLRQFCCGCSLGTGTLIIGIFEIVGGMVNLILRIIAAVEAGPDPREQESFLDALDTIRVSNIIIAVISALLMLLGVLLIVGAKKNRPSYLVPWMVYTCFYVFASVVSNVINTVAYSDTGDVGLAVASAIGAIISVAVQTYFILIVYSLYRELRGDDLLYDVYN